MFKIIVDTNIIVSALIKQGSNPELILSLVLSGKFVQICISDDIFTEYREVLSYGKFKKHLDSGKIKTLLSQIKRVGLQINPHIPVTESKDLSDNKFLECALEAKADFLITGNIKHFPSKKFRDTHIVTPKEFLVLIAKTIVE